ncbi:MAG: peptide/nickel transport system substrate-binding protein [Thermomicrobiales bacterium]|nr:peptide/nickel transport system substrate-binding protein [Thermomicrobiales bacterium]
MSHNESVEPRDRANRSPLTSRVNRRRLLTGAAGGAVAVATPAAQRPLGAAPFAARQSAADRRFQAEGGEVVVAGIGEPKFDPYFLNSELRDVQAQIFRAPFDYRGADPYAINPALAESYEETETTLTLKLRQGVKFHNGREVTAQDIVDNIARAKDESLGHNLSALFGPTVESAEAIDTYTAKLTYKLTYPTKLQDLVYLFLIPKEAMGEIATKPVGCGPFSFVNYAPGDTLELARFEDYYEEGKPYLDKVTVKVLADAQAQLANLSAGAVDVVTSVPLADTERLTADANLQVLKYPAGGVWNVVLMNCKKPPLDNKLVRQALNYTIDRETINNLAYFGQFIPTQTRYLSSVPWYSQEADSMYSYDIDKAKALLKEAGFENGFETTLAVSSVIPGSKEMAQVWAQDLAKAGITAEIDERDQSLFFDSYFKGEFDLLAYTLGDGTIDPATYLANNSPLRTENNTCGIDTQPFFAEYKQLLQDGANSIDPAVRKPIYDRVQVLSAEEGWVINLAFTQDALALSKRIQGYQPDITQVTNLTGVSVES